MLFSAEYRFPIWNTLRGLGTAPLFIKDISGAIFADYGNAWNPNVSIEDTFDNFLLLHEEPAYAMMEPIPLRPTVAPPGPVPTTTTSYSRLLMPVPFPEGHVFRCS